MKVLISFQQALEMDELSQKKYQVPAAILMERAGMGCARVLFEDMDACGKDVLSTTIVAVCGASNNGGDAQVVLREAHARGAMVKAFFIKEINSDLAQMQCAIMQALEIPYVMATAAELRVALSALNKGDYIIDGITGVGLRGVYREPAIIEAVNDARRISGARVLAIDVPSGMISEEPHYGGEVLPIIQADITASIGMRKLPMYFPSHRTYCGDIVDVEHVFPVSVVNSETKTLCAELGEPAAYLLEEKDLQLLHAPLSRDVYKHKRGSLAIACGSEQSPGAGFLALEAATRGSTGVVYAAFDTSIAPHAALACPSAVVSTLGLSSFVERVASTSLAIDAWVVGCGWGMREIDVLANVCNTECPVICDADALIMLASCPRESTQWKNMHACPKVFTPHVGELYSLHAGMKVVVKEGVQGIRCFETAQVVATHYNAVVVAKNSVSYIVHPCGQVPYVLDGREPMLATGGSGDLLSGFLGSVVARECAAARYNVCEAQSLQDLWRVLHKSAAYAALVHLQAGRHVARVQGSGNASDIGRALSVIHTLV